VQRFIEAFEAAAERAMLEELAPDFVSHSVLPGFTEDADGFVQLAKQVKSGMPDGKTTIHDMFAAGEKVAVRFSHTGTHQGELFGRARQQPDCDWPTHRDLSLVWRENCGVLGRVRHVRSVRSSS